MKQTLNSLATRFIILAIVFYTFFGCNNNSSSGEEKDQTPDSSSTIKKDENKSPEEAEAELKENLANQTPLSADALKAMLPSSLKGAQLENADFSSSTGAATVNAEYKINDSVTVQLSLVDCAGPAGSGFFTTQWLDRIKAGNGVIEFKGGKAILETPADSPERIISWFAGNRYLLTLYGEKIDVEELKSIAKEIEIK